MEAYLFSASLMFSMYSALGGGENLMTSLVSGTIDGILFQAGYDATFDYIGSNISDAPLLASSQFMEELAQISETAHSGGEIT